MVVLVALSCHRGDAVGVTIQEVIKEYWDSGANFLDYNYVLSGGVEAMYCNYCGKVIQDNAAVCSYCGIRLGASEARKRLVRPRQGRKIAGVCLGFAEYFDVDVTLVRLVWLIASFMTGIGLISYPIAWIIMPEEPLMLNAPAGAQQVTSA